MPMRMLVERLSPIALCFICIAAFLSTGCGAHTSVSGKVSYEDGTLIPAKRIYIQFFPEAANVEQNQFMASGTVDVTTGAFADVTNRNGQGTPVGKCKVMLMSTTENGNSMTDEIPEEYRTLDTTPLTVDIQPKNGPLTITVKKPAKRR